MEEWVKKNNGQILKELTNSYIVLCENDHHFQIATTKDWCKECASKDHSFIAELLDQMRLKYTRNVSVDNSKYDFKVSYKGRVFLMDLNEHLNLDKAYAMPGTNDYFFIVYNLDSEKCLIDGVEKLHNILSGTEKYSKLYFNSHAVETVDVTCTEVEEIGPKSLVKRAKYIPDGCRPLLAYVRVSTSDQADHGYSLEDQEREIYKKAKQKGYYPKAIYIDKGLTGKDMKRLAVNKMMEEVKEKETVMVKAISRFMRNFALSVSAAEELRKRNVGFVTLEMDIDLESAAGRMIFNVISSVAQMEAEQTSERTKSSIQYLKEQGRYRTKPGYGYRLNPSYAEGEPVLLVNEEEQKIIKQIKILRKVHPDISMYAFTKIVNSEFDPPRKAKEWRQQVVKKLLS